MGERAFLERVRREVLLGDGSPAALLDARAVGGIPELLNLHDRRQVEELHIAFIRAGARVIRTNTLGANPVRLRRHGLAGRVWELNVWGAKLARSAREVAGEPVFVAGVLGPLAPARAGTGNGWNRQGARNGSNRQGEGAAAPPPAAGLPAAGEPGGPAGEDLLGAYRQQVEALLAGGVDLFLVEAAEDARQALAAVRAVRSTCHLPVAVVLSFAAGGPTPAGQAVGEALTLLRPKDPGPPDLLGPCGDLGPQRSLELARSLRAAGWVGPLWVLAGPAGAEADFGELVASLAALGPGVIGGTAGVTPAHVAAARQTLASLGGPAPLREEPAGSHGPEPRPPSGDGFPVSVRVNGTARARPATGPQPEAVAREVPGDGEGAAGSVPAGPVPPVPVPRVSCGGPAPGGTREPAPTLREKLGRQFVVSVELDPPRGTVVNKFLDDARRLGEAGADCINVGDSPMARVRMAAIGGAHLIQAATGMETIVHFTTRDRNLMAIQADLLAAHALGLRNILALTGDNPRLGNTAASAVYDVDSVGLLQILRELNQGRDITGHSIGEPTAFTVACALSPNAEDLDRELDRFRRKLEAGVDFVMTQPLYETAPLEQVLDRLGGCPVPIVMGVMPLHSARHAHYLHHEVPGISIPAPIREALERAGDRGLEVGLELAEAVVEAARPWIAGVYVVVSFGKVEPIAAFVRRLKARFAGGAPDGRSGRGGAASARPATGDPR